MFKAPRAHLGFNNAPNIYAGYSGPQIEQIKGCLGALRVLLFLAYLYLLLLNYVEGCAVFL